MKALYFSVIRLCRLMDDNICNTHGQVLENWLQRLLLYTRETPLYQKSLEMKVTVHSYRILYERRSFIKLACCNSSLSQPLCMRIHW